MDPAIQAAIDAAVQAAEAAFQAQLQQTQQQLAQAQQQLMNLQAAQVVAAQPPPQPPAVPAIAPPAPVNFAYSPATTGAAAALIDYTTTNGAKVQKAAIEKLHVEHDLDRNNLHDFLEALRSRAITCGWYETLLMVPVNGVPLNILDNYGTITREATNNHSLGYMFHNTRAAQDSHNLFCCLEASLTNSARASLYAESDTYTFRRGDVPGAAPGGDDEERRRDGLMFLWSIINRTTAMTTATLSVLIDQIFNLSAVMQENNNDVQAFNTKVRKLLNAYYANKRQPFDETVLLNSLAKAYLSCKDEEFVAYIKRKWSDHQDNTRPLTSTEIMEFALKQYQTSVQNNVWGIDSKQVKSIMNLTSQVGELRKWKRDKSKEEGEKKQNNDGKSDKQYVSASEYRKQRYESAPQWMKREPTDNKTTKKVKGVEYHWCTHHKLWQKHKPADCRLNPANRHNTNSKNNRNDRNQPRTDGKDSNKGEAKTDNGEKGTEKKVTFAPVSSIAAVHTDLDDF
jgi:hypothetical protein